MLPNKPKKILLLRHFSTGPRWAGRYLGSTDVDVAPWNDQHLRALAAAVARFRPAAFFSSPLRRCGQTAGALAPCLGRPVFEEMNDLREVAFGRWEGRTFSEIVAADPELVADWSRGEDAFAFPGGESLRDFRARVRRAADNLAARPEDSLLLVTHGGVIRALICHFLGIPAKNHLLFEVHPGSLAVIELFDGGGVLTGLNLGLDREEE